MVHRSWLIVAAVFALLPLSGDGGLPAAAEPSSWRQSVMADLHPGDIVFRRGVGPLADAVSAVSFSSAGRARWTHVGIVAQPAPGGPLYVVHAIDGRGVVMDTPGRFFSSKESSEGGFIRIENGASVAEAAMRFVGRPFDASFSMADQTALYCTELILVSMREAGVTLQVQPRGLPLVSEVFLPDDLSDALALNHTTTTWRTP